MKPVTVLFTTLITVCLLTLFFAGCGSKRDRDINYFDNDYPHYENERIFEITCWNWGKAYFRDRSYGVPRYNRVMNQTEYRVYPTGRVNRVYGECLAL